MMKGIVMVLVVAFFGLTGCCMEDGSSCSSDSDCCSGLCVSAGSLGRICASPASPDPTVPTTPTAAWWSGTASASSCPRPRLF